MPTLTAIEVLLDGVLRHSKAIEPEQPPGSTEIALLVRHTDLDQVAVGIVEATAILPRPERRGAARFGDRLAAVVRIPDSNEALTAGMLFAGKEIRPYPGRGACPRAR